MLLDEVVDLGADPPDDLAAAFGQPELRSGVLEPRVLARRDEAMDLVLQRWDPGGVVLVDLPGEIDEGLAVLLGLDRADGEGGSVHARTASPRSGQAPVKVVPPNCRHYFPADR
jgi:hypothetical protein